MTEPQPIRWGIISTAKIAKNRFIPAAKEACGCELRAVASRDLSRAQSYAEENGVPVAYGSYDELFADPEIDAVYNPLPNGLHAEWTIRAMRAGKHVLNEKPQAANAAEAEEMAAVAEECGVQLLEAFMWRFHPQHHKVKELVAEGRIGKVRMFRGAFTFGMNPIDRNNVRFIADLAGGALMDVGCYPISGSRFHFEEEPLSVVGIGEYPDDLEVDLSFGGVLEYSDNRLAVFDCGMHTFGRQNYEVIGLEGQISVPLAWVPSEGPARVLVQRRGETEEVEVPETNQYARQIEHFDDCIRGTASLAYPPADAVAQMRVIDALYQSHREGRRVKLTGGG